jgi:hypothetical protein
MRKRISWLPTIVILSLLGTGSIAPALARGGATGSGGARASSAFFVHGSRTFTRSHAVTPRFAARNRAFIARNIGVRNGLRFRGGNQFLNSWPLGFWPDWWSDSWPYSWPTGTTPVAAGQGPSDPSVIVISSVPNLAPVQTPPQAPPDYSYVPGCHAVPNGYHCDVHPNAGAAP